MTLSLVFNELSLHDGQLAPDARTARQWMSGLVTTLKTAVDHNVNRVRTDRNFADMMLAQEYPFRKWVNDPSVTVEEQDFLLTYLTQYPLIIPPTADLPKDNEVRERSELFEAQFNGQRGNGLGYAVLFDSISLSLLSEPYWDASIVDLICTEYSPELDDLIETPLHVRHASRGEHISQNHAQWIEERLRNAVRDGNDLWARSGEWFPNLTFCENARRQIQTLHSGTPQLSGIVERLLALEAYCKMWESGGFDRRELPPQYECSPESAQTLNRFRQQREFICPDGERRLFDLHLKGLRGHWRVHIWPDEQTRTIIVGYVGPHLPTDSDPT